MTESRLVRNTGVSTIVYLLGSVAGLVLVPILLRTLGPTQFGLYVLAQTMLSYSTLLGGGMNRGFIRSIVAADVDTRGPDVRAVVGTGVTLMAGLGVGIGCLAALGYPFMLVMFHVPSNLARGFAWILGGATMSYTLNAVVTPYQGLLVARERLDISKAVEALSIVIGSAASAVAAIRGYGLPGVAISMATVAALAGIATIAAALRVDRDAAGVMPGLDRSVIRGLWSFGFRVQLVALAGMVNRSVDRISIGLFQSPAAVATYDVGDRAAFSIVYTANTLAEALMPRMAGHLARDDAEGARNTYVRAAGVFSLAAVTLAAFAAFNSPMLLRAWLGQSFDVRSMWVMAILATGYGVSVSFSACNVVAFSEAKPTLAMRFSIVQASVNIVLSLVGAWTAGILGAAAGSAVSGALGAVTYSILVERRLLDARHLIGLRKLGMSLVVALPLGGLLAVSTGRIASTVHAGRLGSFALLAVALCIQLAAGVVLGAKVGLLPADETRALIAGVRARLR